MLGKSVAGLCMLISPNLTGRDSKSLSSDEQVGRPVRAGLKL